MAIAFFLPLLMLGSMAVLAVLVVLAIAKNWAAVFALIGGVALFMFLSVAVLAFFYLAAASPRTTVISPSLPNGSGHITTHWTVNEFPEIPTVPSGMPSTRWSIALKPMLFIIFGVIALLILAGRRGIAHAAGAHTHGRIWPAFLALPILALLLLGAIRVNTTPQFRTSQRTASEVNSFVQKQQAAMAKQQQAMAKKVAAMDADLQKRIRNTDIHVLMDKFDAPRILLQTPAAPSAAPAAMMIAAAAPAAVAEEAELPESSDMNPSTRAESGPTKNTAHPSATHAKRNAKATVVATDSASKSGKAGARRSPHLSDEASQDGRPAWVVHPPKRVGDVQREVIVTDDWSTDEECDRARNIAIMLKVYEHIQKLIGLPYQSNLLSHDITPDRAWTDYRLSQLNSMGITADYALQNIATDEYRETVDRSVGPMKKLYTLVEFSPMVDRELRQRWDGYTRREQFAKVGLGGASVLFLLGMVWGLLKIDTATKGYYTKRLFLGVPAAIIGVGFVLWLLVDPLHVF